MIISGIARLGADATLKMLPSGSSVANISAAFTIGWGDKKETTWIKCSLWGKQAEALSPYLLKGNQVNLVLDDLKMTSYRANDGTDKYSLEAKVIKVDLIGGQNQEGKPANTQPARQQKAQQKPPVDDFEDDDIPF